MALSFCPWDNNGLSFPIRVKEGLNVERHWDGCLLFFFNWNIVDLQYCCVNFCCIGKTISHTYTYISSMAPQGIAYMLYSMFSFSSVQFSHSVMSDSLRPHELQHARPPVHHQCPEFTQTLVHQVGDAIQPSHPLSSPSPPAPKPSQHQSLVQWVNSLNEVAKVLEFQL